MDAIEFKTRMLEMLPGADPAAMQNWISYAAELEQEDIYPSEDYVDSDDFFEEVYVEFGLVKKHDGHDIARQLFNTSLSFSLNPFEIRGAARLLKGGTAAADICQKAIDGRCERTERELLESDNALDELEKAHSG